jgi:hypothetical protein
MNKTQIQNSRWKGIGSISQVISVLGTVLTLAAICPAAWAQAPESARSTLPNYYLGGLFGGIFPNTTDSSFRFNYGLNLGIEPSRLVGIGGFYTTSTEGSTVSNVTTDQRLSVYGVEGYYKMDAYLPFDGLSLGAKVGLATRSTSLTDATGAVTDASNTNFAIGPRIAYDYAVSKYISVGAETNLIFVTGDQSYQPFNFLGSVKFLF